MLTNGKMIGSVFPLKMYLKTHSKMRIFALCRPVEA